MSGIDSIVPDGSQGRMGKVLLPRASFSTHIDNHAIHITDTPQLHRHDVCQKIIAHDHAKAVSCEAAPIRTMLTPSISNRESHPGQPGRVTTGLL